MVCYYVMVRHGKSLRKVEEHDVFGKTFQISLQTFYIESQG